MKDSEIYNIVEKEGNRLPQWLIDSCRTNFPIEKIKLNAKLSISRVNNISEGIPYITDILNLLNKNLTAEHPRVILKQILTDKIRLADNRMVDVTNQWNGNTFLLFDGDSPVGVSISREEILVNSSKPIKTGRGFGLYVALNQKYRSGIWGPLLIACSIESLIEKDCTEIKGSTSVKNPLVDKLFSRVANKRSLEGEWIRYSLDLKKYEEMKNKFLNIIDYKKQFELLFRQN